MHDIKTFRDDPDRVRRLLAARGDATDVDALLDLDRRHRECHTALQAMQTERNRSGEEIGRARREGRDSAEVLARMQDLSTRLKDEEGRARELEQEMAAWLARIPNLPLADVPAGGPQGNRVVREWGEEPRFPFPPRPHYELGPALGVMDFERGARLTGSFWSLLVGAGARLQRALINFFLDVHTREHGYTETWPPFVVNRRTMTGTGQLPRFEEDLYRCEVDDLFLIPTAEVPLTNIHAGEILPADRLPLCLTAYTPCFRREAGTYGKDTRGLMRLHQFEKVEMVRIVEPERSASEHELLVGHAETLLQRLGLRYRVVLLAAGDMGFGAAKCYDLEVWAPGTGRWLEVSSCSNFLDFQARRMDLRYRPEGGKARHVHTLNGSGMALPRTLIAIFETYQEADGSVRLPGCLAPYLGGLDRIGPVALTCHPTHL
ncbi:MAG: serine--tRNA ligase [Planctomycetes bacterium]|nr:serine--tRNA ligase [Planctomycetota bacterium]